MSKLDDAIQTERLYVSQVRQQECDSFTRQEREKALADVAFQDGVVHRQKYAGTPLAEIFDYEDAALCVEFLEKMKTTAFAGATILRTVHSQKRATQPKRLVRQLTMPWDLYKTAHWRTLGYPIGLSDDIIAREDALLDQWPSVAYLCLDATVRRGRLKKRDNEIVESPTDMRGYYRPEKFPLHVGFVNLTYECTKRIVRASTSYAGYVLPPTELVDTEPTHWYELDAQPLLTVLARTAASYT